MKPFARVSLALTLALLAACKSPPKQAEVDEDGNKIEYVTYTPTGSSIPVRVRKDQLKPTEAQTTHDQNAFREKQTRNIRVPKDSE